MSRDDARREAPTRRDYIKYGGAVVGGGLLAGCASPSDSTSTTSTDADTTDATTQSETATETTTSEDDSYSVELAPAGEVTFDSVPEDVFTILGHHVDMALALGRGDAINAMHGPGYHEAIYRKLTPHLDGVSVDWEGMYSSWPPSKEKLYALDSDVHLADPAKVFSASEWSMDDIEEVEDRIAPWVGNTFSAAHEKPPEEWADDYEYYTLWEIFERIAAVFREQERYEALADVHASTMETIESSLPPESERPSAGMVLFSGDMDSMWGYRLNQPGYYAAHTRPLAAQDAFVDAFGSEFGAGDNEMDYESLLEADPEVLLVLGPLSGYTNIADIQSGLEDHEAASKVTAVQEGQVFAQGARRQGPILHLFQLEMAAKQLYPEQFGEWPGYVDGEPYPEIPAGEQLFDRDRVAAIVNGDL